MNDLTNWRDVINDSCDKLSVTFSDRYLEVMKQQAMKLTEATEIIVSFLEEFREGIDEFRHVYGSVVTQEFTED